MTKLVLLADGGHLKALRWEESGLLRKPRMELIGKWDTKARNHLREEVTDQAGQYRKGSVPGNASNLSDGEEHNLELERRRRALKAVARQMEELLEQNPEPAVFLAAPPEVNSALLEELKPRTRKRIERNLKVDLTRLDNGKIIEQFAHFPKAKRLKAA